MACESCRSTTRSFLRVALRAGAASRPAIRSTERFASRTAVTLQRDGDSNRSFSTTSTRKFLGGSNIMEPYRVIGATERLYKICAKPADYHISEKSRKNDEVKRLEDGEEVGSAQDAGNIWHSKFKLLPTFSTWSHVTMLHLYLLNARLRCFERDVCRQWQQQMIDHFFFECEKKMHVDHNITSSALRQRYLKDIFVQWRGLILAYDEGVIKGDAILASAVWRNLFKGSPEADPRALAAIVSWLRSGMAALEDSPDSIMEQRAAQVLERPVDALWRKVETPLEQQAAEDVASGAEVGEAEPKPAAAV